MLAEVDRDAREELGLADPRDELAKRRRPLRVGDAVEVDAHRVEIDHVGGDRVGRRQLVLTVGPGLALIGEGCPGIGVAGRVDVREVRGPLGE